MPSHHQMILDALATMPEGGTAMDIGAAIVAVAEEPVGGYAAHYWKTRVACRLPELVQDASIHECHNPDGSPMRRDGHRVVALGWRAAKED